MKRISILLIIGLVILNSCGTTAKFNVGLVNVESPADAKQQFGETKITSLVEEGISKYNYEDDYIKIKWSVGIKNLSFTITNKTNSSIKILWDEMSYIDHMNISRRVMHSGVKYINRNESQPPTIVARNSTVVDLIIPTDNIYFASGQYGGWQERPLFKGDPNTFIGKTVKVLFPMSIENITNEYVFEFKIEDIVKKVKYLIL